MAHWSAKQKCSPGSPGSPPRLVTPPQLTPRSPACHCSSPAPHPTPSFPPHPPHPSMAKKTGTTSWITETRRAGFLMRVVSVTPWCRHWEGPALARARQGLVPRKAAGASCRAPPPGGIGSDEPKHWDLKHQEQNQ